MKTLKFFARNSAANDRFEGIAMGDEVRDSLTGFTGTCTGLCQHITGCDQALIQPVIDGGGDYKEARWFDVERVEVISAGKVKASTRRTGGVTPPARGGETKI